jgi:hypothetical protein
MFAFSVEFCSVQCVGRGKEFEFAIACDKYMVTWTWLWYEHESASHTEFINMLDNISPDNEI